MKLQINDTHHNGSNLLSRLEEERLVVERSKIDLSPANSSRFG